MFTGKIRKNRLARLKPRGINPMVAQVRKMLTEGDQRLILMVRG